MKYRVLQNAEDFIKARRSRKRLHWVAAGLAAAGVFAIIYFLMPPAFTMEKACDIPEHTHSESCYEGARYQKLVCDQNLHRHGTDCFDAAGNVICGYADFFVHEHTAACFDEAGNQVCPLPEIKAHTHDASCYPPVNAVEETIHTHTESCYIRERGELICGQHIHSEDCWTQTAELTCQLEESEEHLHSDSCYEVKQELICGYPDDHQHSDDCYEWTEQNVCGMDTQPQEPEGDDQGQPTCGREEVILHTHSADCFDENGNRICGMVEVRQHIHSADCWESASLICGMEEHTHDETCQSSQTLPVESTEDALEPLEDDDAYVSALRLDDFSVQSETEPLRPMTVRAMEQIICRFSVETSAYSDTAYQQGRVKLEFVLPLTAQEASFDLEAMSWLDDSEGYLPTVRSEEREFGGNLVSCQILTGYKYLTAPESGQAIPGSLTEQAAITVKDAAPGHTVALEINAAMEHNAWKDICGVHQVNETQTIRTETITVVSALSQEQMEENFKQYLEDIRLLEEMENGSDRLSGAQALLERLQESWHRGELSAEDAAQLYELLNALIQGETDSIAEAAIGSNWMLLRDSGWFTAYSASAVSNAGVRLTSAVPTQVRTRAAVQGSNPSDVQVDNQGGSETAQSDGVTVSKTISGTDLENVFDITLQVQTTQSVQDITKGLDMAVVIVLDISNTMNSDFHGVTRYAAAMNAAELFLDSFTENNALGISQIGFVAFNTDAHQIFSMQSCATAEQASQLKSIMRDKTGKIINQDGYNVSHSRFTNIEAGLTMASDMLNGTRNTDKFIVFLSDGFPTTYSSSGYKGYDPYDATGDIFYDYILDKPCLLGTSYSDMAAIKAREKATVIKEQNGVTIFSIGVDVGGQTIQTYIDQSVKADGYSVVDREWETYEIGDASDEEAYKDWLGTKIGSDYYYDSTNEAGLKAAFTEIFKEIKEKVEAGAEADWVTEDPIPTVGESTSRVVEFISFFNQEKELNGSSLSGSPAEGGENTASYNEGAFSIRWDLKQSGYQTTSAGNDTIYTYQLVYRVRLKNEENAFVEDTIYSTNGNTQLRYRVVTQVNGSLTVSEPKTIDFPIPSVHGYLGELTFQKVDMHGAALAGAEFTLRHDKSNCWVCRGDGTPVSIADVITYSDEDGAVSFDAIPSGHRYLLTETKVPDGYTVSGDIYSLEVAYDKAEVTVKGMDGTQKEWQGKITNLTSYALPETGGMGTDTGTAAGITLTLLALLVFRRKRRREECADQ